MKKGGAGRAVILHHGSSGRVFFGSVTGEASGCPAGIAPGGLVGVAEIVDVGCGKLDVPVNSAGGYLFAWAIDI